MVVGELHLPMHAILRCQQLVEHVAQNARDYLQRIGASGFNCLDDVMPPKLYLSWTCAMPSVYPLCASRAQILVSNRPLICSG